MPACFKMCAHTHTHTQHRCRFVWELSGGQWAASWFFALKTRQVCSRTRTRACSRCRLTLRHGGCCMWGEEWPYFRRPSLIFMLRINSVCSWVGTPAMESSLWAAAGWPGLHASHPLQWPFLLLVAPHLHSSVFLPPETSSSDLWSHSLLPYMAHSSWVAAMHSMRIKLVN